jgi:hypothetical protein
MADTTKIRTTLTPGDVIEVGPAELLDLERLNLIDSREGDAGWADGVPVPMASGQLDPPAVKTPEAAPVAPVTPANAASATGNATEEATK